MNLLAEFKAIPEAHVRLLSVVLVCFLVVFLKPALGKTWREITQDSNGHTVAKDLFKAIAFFVGLGTSLYIVYTDVRAGRSPSSEVVFFLLAYALGGAGLKVYEIQQNRKTATDAGQPLVEPGYTPPVPMPQPVNPNHPSAHNEGENCG